MHIRIRKWVKIVFFIIVLISCFFIYSKYLGTKGLKVKEYAIINSNIPENFYGLKIIHFGDIHYKITTNKNDLKNIVKEINLLKPDIVIFSGDLFDKNIKYTKKDIKDLTDIFKSINFNIGKYAIKGENDINDNWEKIIKDSNFIDINDKSEIIYSNGLEPIFLVGINDYKNIKDNINSLYNEKYKYSILVMHKPDYINNIDYNNFNLILSGHSHGGQIVLPFIKGIIRPNKAKIYYDNYYKLNNTDIFITSGIGTHKYKLRFLNKPSINLYRLRNK